MRARPHLAIPRNLLDGCRVEADRTFPLESGGVLMGERLSSECWRIDHIIGPGPGARHERYRFTPDPAWQHERIAERFLATGGRSTYLGDWHSHPGACHGRLSYVDRGAARAILRSPDSQCDRVLMAIVWGRPDDWDIDVWACELGSGWLWNSGMLVVQVETGWSDHLGDFVS